VPLRNVEQNKGGEPSSEKDFETQHSGVFASPGLPPRPFSTAESGFKGSTSEFAVILLCESSTDLEF
jgi:hypothetical protein